MTSLTYWHGLLYASLAWIFWGLAPILYKRALREMGPCKANFFRGVGMLALLIPLFCFMGEKGAEGLLSIDSHAILTLALIAVANNMIGDVFYLIAIRGIGVSLAAPITSAYPLGVALAAWLWFGETLTVSVICGTFFVVAGLALLNARASCERAPSEENRRHLRGVAAALLAALCWALGLSLNKYLLLRGVSPAGITFWRGILFSSMAFVSLPWAIGGEYGTAGQETRSVSIAGFLAAACSGISSLVLGGWFYANSLLVIPISVATPLASSNPLLAAAFACTFMGESLRPVQWLGIVCVVGGAVVVGL